MVCIAFSVLRIQKISDFYCFFKIPANKSYIQGCAFHDGFSPAIGVFGTEGLNIDDNIIHHTVGEGKQAYYYYGIIIIG